MSTLRMVVLDDDAMMLQMLPPYLEEIEGPQKVSHVSVAQTPEAALEVLDREPAGPLVFLSDFNLKATRNGIDVLQEVRKRRPDAVRILFSGYSLDQLGLGADLDVTHGFVEKPLRIREMLPEIEAIIARHLPR